MTLTSRVRKRPVLAFYLLTFAISWTAWWPMAADHRGWIDVALSALYITGGLGPGIAAYVVMRILRGRRAGEQLLGALLRWRVRWTWYVVAVLLYPLMWALTVMLSGTWDAELAALGSGSAVLMALLRYLLAAVPEELGWRGLALPALQARYSALTASLIVGLLWTAWHLPLVLGGDPLMSAFPLPAYVVWMLAESVLYTWLYNSTRGSLLIVVVIHALSNVFSVFSTAPWTTAVITVGVAAVVVLVAGPRHLCRAGPRVTLTGTDPAPLSHPVDRGA